MLSTRKTVAEGRDADDTPFSLTVVDGVLEIRKGYIGRDEAPAYRHDSEPDLVIGATLWEEIVDFLDDAGFGQG